MGIGLEVFDASGNSIVHLGHRLYKILTIADVGVQATGSVTNSEIKNTNGVVAIIQGAGGGAYKNPTVTVNTSTNTVSWDYGAIPAAERYANTKLSIGIY